MLSTSTDALRKSIPAVRRTRTGGTESEREAQVDGGAAIEAKDERGPRPHKLFAVQALKTLVARVLPSRP
jgi:hypothetical protein